MKYFLIVFGLLVFGAKMYAEPVQEIRKCSLSLESYAKAKGAAAWQVLSTIRNQHKDLNKIFKVEDRVYVREYLEQIEWRVCEKASLIEKPEFKIEAYTVTGKTACGFRSSLIGNAADDLSIVGRLLLEKGSRADVPEFFSLEVNDFIAKDRIDGLEGYSNFVCGTVAQTSQTSDQFCGHAFSSYKQAFQQAFTKYWNTKGKYDKDSLYQALKITSSASRPHKNFPSEPVWKVCVKKMENE